MKTLWYVGLFSIVQIFTFNLCTQAQVKANQNVPNLIKLNTVSGSLARVDRQSKGKPIFGEIDLGKYESGVVYADFKVNGTCNAVFLSTFNPGGDKTEIRAHTRLLAGKAANTVELFTLDYGYASMYNKRISKFYMSADIFPVGIQAWYSGDCAGNYEITVYIKASDKKCSTYLRDFIEPSPGSPGTFVAAAGAFTRRVLMSLGKFKCSIGSALGNRKSFIYIKKPDIKTGHHYLTLNSLGKSDLTPKQIINYIVQDPTRVFPYFDATGTDGQSIKIGNTYSLNYSVKGYELVSNNVKVTSLQSLAFTFTTDGKHWLQGSATHGVFKDDNGEIWLFQEGTGVVNENETFQEINYMAANVMWGKMAENLKRALPQISNKP